MYVHLMIKCQGMLVIYRWYIKNAKNPIENVSGKSIREILFFPDSDDLDDEFIMKNEKRCTVLPHAKPVSRRILRTILNFHNIMPLVGTGCKLFQCEFNMNPVSLLNG